MDPSLILVVGLGGLLLFMILNTRKKQKEQQAKLSTGLVPGAEVMTSFGVYGTVLEVDQENNKVVIESGPGTRLVVHRQAIGQVTPTAVPAEDAEADAVEDQPQEPVSEIDVEPASGTDEPAGTAEPEAEGSTDKDEK